MIRFKTLDSSKKVREEKILQILMGKLLSLWGMEKIFYKKSNKILLLLLLLKK